jgi:hypothetical protein
MLIKEDFSGGEQRAEPKLWGGGPTWNIPETWEIRDGAIACIYDGKAHAVGNEDAGNTHKLIDAAQAAAHGGRCGFSYVTGHD